MCIRDRVSAALLLVLAAALSGALGVLWELGRGVCGDRRAAALCSVYWSAVGGGARIFALTLLGLLLAFLAGLAALILEEWAARPGSAGSKCCPRVALPRVTPSGLILLDFGPRDRSGG